MRRAVALVGYFLAKSSLGYINLRRFVYTRVPHSTLMSHDSIKPSTAPPNSVDEEIRCFLQSVYRSEETNIFSLYTTGGGASAIPWIFGVPGASRSVLEASVPYGRSALNRVVNYNGDSQIQNFCSRATADRMASSALKSSVEMLLLETNDLRKLCDANIIGIGCTAAIASVTPKKGEHRCFVSSARSGNAILSAEITMIKGLRSREEEDNLCSRMIMDTLYASISRDDDDKNSFPFTNGVLNGNEVISQSIQNRSIDVIDDIREGRKKMCLFVPKHCDSTDHINIDNFVCYENINLPPGSIVYPGSFNPLHTGHVELALASIKAIEQTVECPPPLIFEISVANADKAPLERDEIIHRIQQFSRYNGSILANAGIENYGISITSEPFFRAKSEIFKNCKFVLGVDTLSRLMNVKYYENSGNLMINAFQIMRERGCSLIVGGRVTKKDDEEIFESLEDLLKGLYDDNSYDSNDVRDTLINLLHSMSIGISEDKFRVDLSSTEIRLKTRTQKA